MKQPKTRSSFSQNLALFIAMVLIWILFAPVNLGGRASYVMVNGISMEPNYHTGDLVILRSAMNYQVGDVVTYRDVEMGAYVIHRIISIKQGQFEIKGDNNSWVDAYHPTDQEILGRQWVHLPQVGSLAKWLGRPIHLSLAVFLLGGVLMISTLKKTSKFKNSKDIFLPSSGMMETSLSVLAIVFLACLGMTIFAFTRPLVRSADDIQYQQEGTYSYSAAATPGVYDGTVVQSGEPIFPKLTCFLNLGFAYNLPGNSLRNTSGSYQMIARVADEQSGWQRTLPLTSQTAFSGFSFTAAAPLDLCQLTTLISMVESETGLRANTYLVEIMTNVTITSDASGQVVTDNFHPLLAFKFDKVHLYLADTAAGTNPMRAVQQGLMASNNTEVNTFSLLGLQPSVYSIRVLSFVGAVFSLLGLGLLGFSLIRATQHGEETMIGLKYGGMLMEVYDRHLPSVSQTMDVASIDHLARLAERQGGMILHMVHEDQHLYWVQGNGVTYQYTLNNGEHIPIMPLEVKSIRHETVREYSPLTIPSPETRMSIPEQAPVKQKIPDRHTAATIEKRSAQTDPQAAWQKIQAEACEYLQNHAKHNNMIPRPAPHKTTEYVIRTGEIDFYENEPMQTVILGKIKI